MRTNKYQSIPEQLDLLFPETHCFLNYKFDYQLLFAVILSAQATDESVNKATSILFEKYKDLSSYNYENYDDIFDCIKTVGLGKSKTKYLIETASILLNQYDGKVPKDRVQLMKLPGVGFKTSGVVLAELYNYQYIPVDTHIHRVSIRLGIVDKNTSADKTELKLEKLFSDISFINLHRQMILFGRNICTSIRPKCELCPFTNICKQFKSNKK